MTSTIVDPSLFGSPVTPTSSGYQSSSADKSRLSHNGDDPGGGGDVGGDSSSLNSLPSKDAMRQSLKDVIRYVSAENFGDMQIAKKIACNDSITLAINVLFRHSKFHYFAWKLQNIFRPKNEINGSIVIRLYILLPV